MPFKFIISSKHLFTDEAGKFLLSSMNIYMSAYIDYFLGTDIACIFGRHTYKCPTSGRITKLLTTGSPSFGNN